MPEAFDPFEYHEPTENQRTAIEAFRQKAKDFREALDCLPPSREKALAVTNLEQTLMWANKAAVAPPPAPPRYFDNPAPTARDTK